MFKQDGKTFTLHKQVVLSERQKYRFNALPEKERQRYLLSILGLSTKRLSTSVNKGNSNDPLDKRKGSVLAKFDRLLDNKSEVLHRPLTHNASAQWIGVEIECLIGGTEGSDCEYCEGSGEETCSNCEGSGEIELEDSNGNTYMVRCGECDGSGSRECSECNGSSSQSDVFEKVRQALRKHKVTRCSVKEDGSLSMANHVGVEVTLLLDVSQGFEPIERVCSILNGLGAKINDTCGLHVHLDYRHLRGDEEATKEVRRRFKRFLPALSLLIPKIRRSNRYCALSVSNLTGERYHAINLTALQKHGTIEVRLHSGTTNSEKIINWIKLLGLIRSAPVPLTPVSSFQRLIDTLKIKGELLKYLDLRYQKFNERAGDLDDETEGVDDQCLESLEPMTQNEIAQVEAV